MKFINWFRGLSQPKPAAPAIEPDGLARQAYNAIMAQAAEPALRSFLDAREAETERKLKSEDEQSTTPTLSAA